MTPPLDLTDKDALIATLTARLDDRDATIMRLGAWIEVLVADNAKLTTRVAKLETKFGGPRKGSGQFQRAAIARAQAVRHWRFEAQGQTTSRGASRIVP